MSISVYLKQIGRGSKGASDLNRTDAQSLFSEVIERKASDLEIGAFCLAMRIKGETAAELAGFYDASLPYLPIIQAQRPTVLLPSYNGSRKTLLFTPLLAKSLTEHGLSVLVHGTHEEQNRLGSGELFGALGWPVATSVSDIGTHLNNARLTYCPLDVLSPRLSDILAIRRILGLRNSAHILAKLINPVRTASLQICNYTHPAYPKILDEFFTLHSANAILMRGHEGEPVASSRRLPELHIRIAAGNIRIDTEAILSESALAYTDTTDLKQTVSLYQKFLDKKLTIPMTLSKQIDLIVQSMASVTDTCS